MLINSLFKIGLNFSFTVLFPIKANVFIFSDSLGCLVPREKVFFMILESMQKQF